MKTIFIYLLPILLTACIQTRSGDNTPQQIQEEAKTSETALSNLFTLPDAEKILGEAGHLEDSTTKGDAAKLTYQCAYKANQVDSGTEKTGAVYFLIEQYNQVSSAHEKYDFIKKANEDHGIKVLSDLGDEAYFHSDGKNFYFIMVRKGVKVFNMKLNKITAHTSLDQFNAIAQHITASL